MAQAPNIQITTSDIKALAGNQNGNVVGDLEVTGTLSVNGTPVSGGLSTAVDIQTFTANGTWTKPAGAKWVQIEMMGGGGGGGAGRKGAPGSYRSGGGGGSGSGLNFLSWIPAAIFNATEPVVVGSGGAGAPSQTTDSTNGAAGSNGTDSLFGTTPYIFQAGGAFGGLGGDATGGGTVPTEVSTDGGINGGTSRSTAVTGAGVNGTGRARSASSGGSGGGIPTSDVAVAGGRGGFATFARFGTLFTGTPGSGGIGASGNVYVSGTVNAASSPTNTGAAGTAVPVNMPAGGQGGGGGFGRTNIADVSDGSAGGNYAGGGAGGGAGTDSVVASGAGGAGASGIVVITTWI